MKYLFVFLLFLCSFGGQGQTYFDDTSLTLHGIAVSSTSSTAYITGKGVYSGLDTTVLFKGVDTFNHKHEFVSESKNFHSFELNENQICELCLKHINIKEIWLNEDRYLRALDRLNKLKNGNNKHHIKSR